MRDLQRLEELSSKAAFGMWADDVVVALDRSSGEEPVATDADRELLGEAAELLQAAARRAEEPLATPASARALAATDTALSAAATLASQEADGDVGEILSEMATVIRQAAGGTADLEPERLDAIMGFFGLVGEHQLIESNSVLTSRKDLRAWSATQAI